MQIVAEKNSEKLLSFVIWKFWVEMHCLKRSDHVWTSGINSTKPKSLDLDNFQNICIKYLYYKCVSNFGLKSLNRKTLCVA